MTVVLIVINFYKKTEKKVIESAYPLEYSEYVEDAAKAAQITLSADEVKELEALADTLGINAVRMWEKEMK